MSNTKTYEVKTMNLGTGRFGGLMDVTIAGDIVTVEQRQIVPGTNGTEWIRSAQEMPIELWNAHKEAILANAVEV